MSPDRNSLMPWTAWIRRLMTQQSAKKNSVMPIPASMRRLMTQCNPPISWKAKSILNQSGWAGQGFQWVENICRSRYVECWFMPPFETLICWSCNCSVRELGNKLGNCARRAHLSNIYEGIELEEIVGSKIQGKQTTASWNLIENWLQNTLHGLILV